MSVADYEVGRQPGPPTAARVEVDPIRCACSAARSTRSRRRWPGCSSGCPTPRSSASRRDLGAGIFDADGRELCESDSTPMHIGSLPWYIRGFLHRLGDDIEEGDVIVHNHPYLGASRTPRRGGRGADLPRRRAARLGSGDRPRARRRGLVPGDQRRRVRRLCGGEALQRAALVPTRRAQRRRRPDDLRQRPHRDDEPRRHEPRCSPRASRARAVPAARAATAARR